MNKTTKSAFTIIELLVVITIIGILSTVGIVSFANIQSSTRDSQRSSKITIIAEALEKYYSQHGEYPSCTAMSQSASTVVANTLVGVDPTNLTTPSSTRGTNSFAAPATVSCNPSITILASDVFAYVGDSSDSCLTTSGQTAACLEYTLKYREESTGNTISLVSRHTIPTLATPAAPTTTVTLNGSNVLATISATCPAGAVTQYGTRNRTNDGSWSGYTAWSTNNTATQVANQGVKYEYQSQARCYPDGSSTSASSAAVGAVSNAYVNPITAIPTVPGVTANTVGPTTTWSWGASTGCASGTVVNYQYNYLIDSVSQTAGWKTPDDPAALSIGFTTAIESHMYTVAVQAKCTNTNANGSWSGAGSANYSRPITQYTLTTIAGTNGTVNAGGTYNAGSTPTITATPNALYVFSSWSGSTGCSGVASHTITMDANKSCTANFTLGANWLAIGTQVWAKANLNVGTRINGGTITGGTNQTNNSIHDKYSYADTESNCTTYGGLYQWDEAMQYVTTQGAQGICPTGSHIPSDNEWKILEMQLGMLQAAADATGWRGTDQGTQLKSGGTSGLNMPLAGYRGTAGSFYSLSSIGFLWSSSESSTSAWRRYLSSGYATVLRDANDKGYGFSVRCL